MKKLFSMLALVAMLFLVPVLVWGVKSSSFDHTLVLDNRSEGAPKDSGANYFFKYAKANPDLVSFQDVGYSIDEMKRFDAVFVSTEDGFETSTDQWNRVKMNIDQNGPSLLFAEYGVIHNAESGELSQLISQDLGVDSTNWSGLFVPDLADRENPAIPEKVFSNLDGEWDYSGPGLVLNNSNEEKAVVVELGDGSQDVALSLVASEYAKERGFGDLAASYSGWFDIVVPRENAETLYSFDLPLNDELREVFAANGIPEQIPAVTVARSGASNRVYLAGTFSQGEAIPEVYQFQGIQRLYSMLERYSSSSFYWNSFFPIMSQSLRLHADFSAHDGADFAVSDREGSQGVQYPARVAADIDRLEVKVDGKFVPMTIKGVNIGMASPGYFPGEAAISEQEYLSWFESIGQMNANTIRVYTLHPPGFYRALASYNAQHEQKIYVLHGVWINEEWITGDADAFHAEAVEGFRQEIEHVVDALHGNALVAEVPGHSSGVYVTDVSDYVAGWVLGTEWDPFMVQGTNEKHQDVGQFDGQYYFTEEASPFEHWLASQMEFTTNYEISKYNEVRPMSFTNWVTTDILHHPSDSSDQEDVSEVNPNHIHTKAIMNDVGQFASYHVYPYYPDFMQMDQKYVTAKDQRGEPNTYHAYLAELRSVHEMPVLVAEFGVPTSRGRTHSGPMGMHQGMVSEKEQGEFIQRMFEDMLDTNYMGGLIFTWQDEWFKRTWNTMDYDNPNRRPYWSNAQTSEQQFGLLSFDTLKVKVDGDVGEWQVPPLYTAEGSDDPIREVYVDHDERYLYLRFDLADDAPAGGYPVALVDTVPDQGNTTINQLDVDSSDAADFMISMEKNDQARVLVDPYYDIHQFFYGYLYSYIPSPENMTTRDSGEFNPIMYVLNQDILNNETGERLPFEEYETGKLREGNGNPESPEYDSLADYAWSADGSKLEVRIPWLLLSFRDPSHKEITGDIVHENSIYASEFIEDIGLSFLFVEGGKAKQTLPPTPPGSNVIPPAHRYTWENWDRFETPLRLKQSYYHVKDYFAVVQ